MLGPQFVSEYFPGTEDTPHVLLPPLMAPEDRAEMRAKLRDCLTTDLADALDHRPLTAVEGFRKFQRAAREAFQTSLDAELAALPKNDFKEETRVIGGAVVALLRAHPDRLDDLSPKLEGRLFLPALRAFVWSHKLNHPETLRRVRNGVEYNMRQQDLDEYHQCPLRGLLQRVSEETLAETPVLSGEVSSSRLARIVEVMCILNLFNGMYLPRHVFLLLPLVSALEGEDAPSLLELAGMFFHLVEAHFPGSSELVAMADRVCRKLESADAEYFAHLVSATQENSAITDKLPSASLAVAAARASTSQSGAHLLAHPVIFLRKWIGEGFIGTLSMSAARFVWDQCFLLGWHTLEEFCLIVLALLRERAMEARDYPRIREVLLDDASLLLTRHVVMAWREFRRGCSLLELASLPAPL
eukprot:m.121895 g.121895  ORF g.121895 m.121895 type:complete len:414 (-) comp9613_c0_seq5:157-1398(-)